MKSPVDCIWLSTKRRINILILDIARQHRCRSKRKAAHIPRQNVPQWPFDLTGLSSRADDVRQPGKRMTHSEQKLLVALVLMVNQYLDEHGDEVDSRSESAGEHAIEALADYGLMEDVNTRFGR